MVDVDMYLDMPTIMSKYPRVYMLSTFQPTKVADKGANYDFTFDEHNNVTYSVSGGDKYNHPVWNYANDVLLVSNPTDYLGLGLNWNTVIYSVERRQYDPHHQIILLVPIMIISSPLYPVTIWLQGTPLQELKLVIHKDGIHFLRMDIMTQEGRKRSTGIANNYHCATVDADIDDTIASQVRISTTSITPHQIMSIVQSHDTSVCSILTEYHRRKIAYTADCVTPCEKSVNRYQFAPAKYDPNAKPNLIAFMSPIIPGLYSPDSCLNNEKRAVEGRVEEIKNSTITITAEIMRYINEFACEVVKIPHQLAPVSQDAVFDKQHRPAQRAILHRAALSSDLVEPNRKIESFIKAEPYPDVKDPRIISTIPGITKLSYSAYTYAFADLLRKEDWYAFGKTPLQIATRVADICTDAEFIHNTDFARFDGRVSNVLRSLERVIMLRAFAQEYHTDLAELMLSQYGQRAITKHGHKYNTDFTRASGSPETADFNSEDNAFVAYIAFRRTQVNGKYLTPSEAYAKLGVYGGDDGVTADVDSLIYQKAASDVGQKMEVDTINRGDTGVSFLSRFYTPYVWFGSMDSICDIRRQLVKLHTTVSLPPHVSAMQKLGEKLSGYYQMDKNTPILGELIATFARVHPREFKLGIQDEDSKRKVANYYVMNYDQSAQYPNEDGCYWMDQYKHKWFPNFDFDLFRA